MCPLRYKYKYVDEWEETNTLSLEVGNAVHKGLEEFINDPELDIMQTIYDNMDLSLFDDESHEMATFTNVTKMVKNFAEWHKTNPNKVIAVEKEFEIPGDPPIKGIIDRIEENAEGELEFVDYKTGKVKETKNTIAGNLQLAVYCQGIKELYGKYPVKATLFYLKHNKIISCSTTKIVFDHHNYEINKMNKYIKGGVFPAKQGYWCNFCSYRQDCEMFK